MRTTLSVIKADIGAVGGHLCPSLQLVDRVKEIIERERGHLIVDSYLGFTGDDIAILMTHTRGEGDQEIHRLAWEAFLAGTAVAKQQGLYGAGQDLLKDAFSGNVRGMGPAVAEIEFEERPNEPFLFFAADKTDPGAYNLPLFLAFADLSLPESQSASRSAHPRRDPNAVPAADSLRQLADTDVAHVVRIVVKAGANVSASPGRDAYGPAAGVFRCRRTCPAIAAARVQQFGRRAVRPLDVRIDGGGRRPRGSPRCRHHRAS